ncbi:MAG: hypothetical protein HKO59_09355 [Phycisphaerales bacterium]|nr:cobalamin-dependent protein [Phycisphaerae bacterium]NNM26176.1 hypothetical protein [Phycisphaerales bacterium]
MKEEARQQSIMLDNITRALAEWTVTRHAETDESLPRRYGQGWRGQWAADTRSRIAQLSQSLAVRRPELFVDAALWARAAHAARGIDPGDLVENLRCLRAVLNDEAPAPVRAAAADAVDRALTRLAEPPPETPVGIHPDQPHGTLVLRYLEALLAGRHRAAEELIIESVAGGLSVADAYQQVLAPAQVEIGRMWHEGEITIADEHLATHNVGIVMSRLRNAFPVQPEATHRVLTTAAAGDLHSIGPRMVSDFFELAGWQTFCLGANTPAAEVVRAVVDYEASLLAVSASSVLHVREVGDVIALVRATPETASVRIIVGGRPFALVSDLWEELGADGTAASLDAAVTLGARLVEGLPAATRGRA